MLLWTIYHIHLLPYYLQIAHMDYFYQTIALSNNQDGHQNGRHLSVYTFGHCNLVIYNPISSKLHIWTSFTKLLFMCEYGYCLMNDYQYLRHGDIPFLLQGIRRGPFSEFDCSSCCCCWNCCFPIRTCCICTVTCNI